MEVETEYIFHIDSSSTLSVFNNQLTRIEELQAELKKVKADGSKAGQVVLSEVEALRNENEELKAACAAAEAARQRATQELEACQLELTNKTAALTAEVRCSREVLKTGCSFTPFAALY